MEINKSVFLTEQVKEYELKRKISSFLYEMKMKTSTIGFSYWLNAICYCVLENIKNYDIIRISTVYTFIADRWIGYN